MENLPDVSQAAFLFPFLWIRPLPSIESDDEHLAPPNTASIVRDVHLFMYEQVLVSVRWPIHLEMVSVAKQKKAHDECFELLYAYMHLNLKHMRANASLQSRATVADMHTRWYR
jgi:hypothetical protein